MRREIAPKLVRRMFNKGFRAPRTNADMRVNHDADCRGAGRFFSKNPDVTPGVIVDARGGAVVERRRVYDGLR